MKKTVGIVGFGWVGRATYELFPNAIVCDPTLSEPLEDAISRIKSQCDCVFVCLPTDWCEKSSRLDTTLISETVQSLDVPLVIIRSTLNVGDTGNMDNATGLIAYWPEFLGETVDHPFRDPKRRGTILLGGSMPARRAAIEVLHRGVNAEMRFRQLSSEEAEYCKLAENRAVAWRVLEFQELYDACESSGFDYYTVREAVYGDDPRFDLWWSFVYPEKRGLNSKCLPKDVLAWCSYVETMGFTPEATKSLLAYSKQLRSILV